MFRSYYSPSRLYSRQNRGFSCDLKCGHSVYTCGVGPGRPSLHGATTIKCLALVSDVCLFGDRVVLSCATSCPR